MSCGICDHVKAPNTHAMLKCPLAFQIWLGCDFDTSLWAANFRSLADGPDNARQVLDGDLFGDFLTVLSECLNARNGFIFNNPDWNLGFLGR